MAGIRGRLALPSQQRRAVPLRYAQRVPVYDRRRGPKGRGGKDPEQLDGSDLNATPAGGQHRASGTADLWLVVPLGVGIARRASERSEWSLFSVLNLEHYIGQ